MNSGVELMFYIKLPRSVIIRHIHGLNDKIEESIKNKKADIKQRLPHTYYEAEMALLDVLLDRKSSLYFENILTATPDELLTIYQTIKETYNNRVGCDAVFTETGIRKTRKKNTMSEVVAEIKKDFLDIFNYEDFCSKKDSGEWSAYELARALNVKTCTYCNNQYTLTVVKRKEGGKTEYIMRPEFDHYYEKFRYPFFALSIYNLIPCCHYCNSVIKGTKSITQKEYLHPFIDERADGHDYFDFYYGFSEPEKTVIKAKFNSDKAERTYKFFQMGLLYAHHTNVTDSMVELAQRYPPSYIDDLVNNYKGKLHITKHSVARMVFSSYEIKDTDNEVLGKLKKDVLKKILKDVYNM